VSFVVIEVMKKINFPRQCPGCGRQLKVKILHCPSCSTEVTGLFELPLLACLLPEEQEFIVSFIKYSGSIKDMAAHMKLSYPTVRNRLDELIEKIKQLEKESNML